MKTSGPYDAYLSQVEFMEEIVIKDKRDHGVVQPITFRALQRMFRLSFEEAVLFCEVPSLEDAWLGRLPPPEVLRAWKAQRRRLVETM